MENLAKPRMAEVLGVEVGEKFAVKMEGCTTDSLIIGDDGFLRYADTTIADVFSLVLCQAINCPESIIHAPHLTEPEMAICRAVGAKWVSRGALGSKTVVLWDEKPECFDDGTFGSTDTAHKLARMYTRFENIHPGDLIPVDLGK